MTKPSVEAWFKLAIAKQSADRTFWSDAKKKAAAKKIDPDGAFKKVKGNLGKELDRLRDLVVGATKFKKVSGFSLDAQGKKIVTDQVKKCVDLIRDYERVCETEAKNPKLSPVQKKAWTDLYTNLLAREGAVDNLSRPVLT